MKKEKSKKKMPWGQYLVMFLSMMVGAIGGFFVASFAEQAGSANGSDGSSIIAMLILFVEIGIAFYAQIIIHEGGHLIFGRLSGYEFSSFRIGSFIWLKENGKLKLKHLSLAGTGGQCLMVPPEMKDGKIPYVLYNLGGILVNIITSVIFLLLFALTKDISYLSTFFLMLAIAGILFAMTNGIPLSMGTTNNDGHNAMSLGKNPEALRAFWHQMKMNDQISKGVRLKNMSAEWFEVPTDEEMKNSMIAAVGVFACNRLMDSMEFQAADELMEKLLAMESGMVGLHRNLLICDRIYCELIGENRKEIVDEMLDKKQKRFMKSMKNFPGVIRTEYTYQLLGAKDLKKAEKAQNHFEKVAKTYPYQTDIISERELMEEAKKRWEAE